MKINWNYIKGFFLVFFIIFLYSFTSKRSLNKTLQLMPVKFVNATNLFVDETMVNKLLIQNGSTIENQPKSMVNLHVLETQIKAHPMVEDATVFLTIDGFLQTVVKQRTPIARIQNLGSSYYLDKKGVKMPLSKMNTVRVPLVTGEIKKNDLKNIYFLVTKINKDAFLKKQIIGIHKNKKNEYELKTRLGDHTILIGTINGINKKFKKLIFFYKKVIKDKRILDYKIVNLKYKNQVVCTK